MLKMMNKKQKTTTNKGFSLVELIVVIAIMAVLVAVLAPAMLRYVENSRKSTDASTVAGVVSTAQAAIIDEAIPGDTTPYQITVTGNGCTVNHDDADGNIQAALTDAYNNLGDIQLKSNSWSTSGVVISITVDNSGATTVTYNSPDETGDDSFANYADLPQTPAAGGNGGQQNP